MFGFSPTKILFTVLIAAAVWFGYRWLNRIQAVRGREGVEPAKRTGGTGSQGPGTEDLVACAVCGDFVSTDRPRACGRADCPYPG